MLTYKFVSSANSMLPWASKWEQSLSLVSIIQCPKHVLVACQ